VEEENKEYNFFGSTLILLQYTKEMSIFASSYNNKQQLFCMKKITGKTYLDWYENMLLWRKFEDKLAANIFNKKSEDFSIYIMDRRLSLQVVFIQQIQKKIE
jgi:hypothetical protein